MEKLRRRRDFLAAATGAKAPTNGFVLQERRRGDEGPARVGFTVSKKVGGAVERNRVRRCLGATTCWSVGRPRWKCHFPVSSRISPARWCA
jgi:ribonuclease P protein component